MTDVALRGITRPIEDMSPEQFIAHCARVSNPSNQNNHASGPKLVKYLIREQHWSPFEMVSMTMEINTTRDIARQILRHRSFSFQEFSQRYADPTQLGFVFRQARLQDYKNRQNSIETDDTGLARQWESAQQQIKTEVDAKYKWAIQKGIAKEQARSILPEGLVTSKLYMAGTLRSWIHFVQVRYLPYERWEKTNLQDGNGNYYYSRKLLDNGTQLEHKMIAEKVLNILLREFPILTEYFESLDGSKAS